MIYYDFEIEKICCTFLSPVMLSQRYKSSEFLLNSCAYLTRNISGNRLSLMSSLDNSSLSFPLPIKPKSDSLICFANYSMD